MKKIAFILILFCSLSFKVKDEHDIAIMNKLNQYAEFTLSADLTSINDSERQMLVLLFKIADIMDELFWIEAYGDKQALLNSVTNANLKKFIEINYGPWERLNGNIPFLPTGEKPLGANFYPVDMTKEEFNMLQDTTKLSQYTLIRRDSTGHLVVVPYHIAFAEQVEKTANLLRQAAQLSQDEGFGNYLSLRADALLHDRYFESDMAWMDMKTNRFDFVVGPIENYEDQLFGIKTSHEAYILLKDMGWSEKLTKYASLLPELQKRLPVDDIYKSELPGSSNDLSVYDVLYYAGYCNAGSKTIAINLPNDEKVQLQKGSRRLQLKNAMKAKYDKILIPIGEELIVPEQQHYITFNAFFSDVMFHEVAHGLGIKKTITNRGMVREALREQYSTIEEGKADILGLFLVTELKTMGEIEDDLMEHYTTFLAGIFRSIRFGSSSAHGKANLIRFNYFQERGAFTRNSSGKYAVNFDKMQSAMIELSREIITIQGNGDYEAALNMVERYGTMSKELQDDLYRINNKGIPVDIIFKQGPDVLGLK
jgi:hypothetical protein